MYMYIFGNAFSVKKNPRSVFEHSCFFSLLPAHHCWLQALWSGPNQNPFLPWYWNYSCWKRRELTYGGVTLCLREGSLGWQQSWERAAGILQRRMLVLWFFFFSLNLPSTAFPFTVLTTSFVLSRQLPLVRTVFTRRCINILPHGEAVSDLRGHLATSAECFWARKWESRYVILWTSIEKNWIFWISSQLFSAPRVTIKVRYILKQSIFGSAVLAVVSSNLLYALSSNVHSNLQAALIFHPFQWWNDVYTMFEGCFPVCLFYFGFGEREGGN